MTTFKSLEEVKTAGLPPGRRAVVRRVAGDLLDAHAPYGGYDPEACGPVVLLEEGDADAALAAALDYHPRDVLVEGCVREGARSPWRYAKHVHSLHFFRPLALHAPPVWTDFPQERPDIHLTILLHRIHARRRCCQSSFDNTYPLTCRRPISSAQDRTYVKSDGRTPV